MDCADQGLGKWKIAQREKNELGNCGPVSRNSTCVDNKYNRLCVIEMVSVLDPDPWMSRDVHGLDGMFHV
jgi:hypothetical protein